MVAARFRPRVVIAGLALTVVVILAVTLGLDPRATIDDPVPVIATLALLTAVVSIVWALETAELHSATKRSSIPLTGLANRRQLSEDLAAIWKDATPERPVRLLMFDLDGFKAYNDTFGHPGGRPAAEPPLARLQGRGRHATAAPTAWAATSSARCCGALRRGDGRALPRARSARHGEGFSITSSFGSVLAARRDRRPRAARCSSPTSGCTRTRTPRAPARARQTRDLALQILAVHEPELHVHSSHVADARPRASRARLGLSDQELADAVRAAELHDIGKVAIPYAVLHKPGPLDEEEWELMRRHPTIGANILSAAPALARVAEIVRATHERYDGSGYPRGLAGEEIPLASAHRVRVRLLRRDDLRAPLPAPPRARRRRSPSCAAAPALQFDPHVVDAFIAEQEILMGEVEIISMLMPSSASTANTFAATPGCERMPAPTIETLPISSCAISSAYASPARGSSDARASRKSSRGTVKEISASPPAEVGSFWTIMSTFTFAWASASKMRAAAPGSSGTPTSVIRASEVEWVTAVMSGCSMVSASLDHNRTGPVLEGRATVDAHAVVARVLDRAQLQHARARGGHLEHLLEGDRGELARVGHDARVGGEDAGHVGVDLAHLRAERRGDGDGGRVRAAAPQRGDVAGVLETP